MKNTIQDHCHNCNNESIGNYYELYVGKKTDSTKVNPYENNLMNQRWVDSYQIIGPDSFFLCDKCIKRADFEERKVSTWFARYTFLPFVILVILGGFVLKDGSPLQSIALGLLATIGLVSFIPWIWYLLIRLTQWRDKTPPHELVKKMASDYTKSSCHTLKPELIDKLVSLGVTKEKAIKLAKSYHWSEVSYAIEEYHKYKYNDPKQLVNMFEKNYSRKKNYDMAWFTPQEYQELISNSEKAEYLKKIYHR